MQKKGFTLIELLVVIGIIAILAVVVILTLNPAELLRQARDSSRISDLGTLKAALSLYLADVTSPFSSPAVDYTGCYESITPVQGGATCGVFAHTSTSYAATASSSRAVDGTGWIPVKFTLMSSGAPIGTLPVDPVNNSTYYYAFSASSSLVFEIDAKMESARYKNGGSNDVVSTDGGDQSTIYEVGTAPGLAL